MGGKRIKLTFTLRLCNIYYCMTWLILIGVVWFNLKSELSPLDEIGGGGGIWNDLSSFKSHASWSSIGYWLNLRSLWPRALLLFQLFVQNESKSDELAESHRQTNLQFVDTLSCDIKNYAKRSVCLLNFPYIIITTTNLLACLKRNGRGTKNGQKICSVLERIWPH